MKLADFSAEFLRYHRALWLVAMSVVANSADADDVLQEAAIIGIRKADGFEPGTNFRAWMGEIVRNVALNRRRQLRREFQRFGYVADAQHADVAVRAGVASPVGPEGRVLSGQVALDDSLLKALMELEPLPRACVLLRCIEELEYSEIAELLNIPKGTAMSHVFRCRRVLAARLATGSTTNS